MTDPARVTARPGADPAPDEAGPECLLLWACAREVAKRCQALLDPLGLTYTQYAVMTQARAQGGAAAKAISEALRLDPSTLTPVLKNLEARGYLTRARDPRDERSLIIRLTGEGLALCDRARDASDRMRRCLGLSQAEAEQLRRLLDRILNDRPETE